MHGTLDGTTAFPELKASSGPGITASSLQNILFKPPPHLAQKASHLLPRSLPPACSTLTPNPEITRILCQRLAGSGPARGDQAAPAARGFLHRHHKVRRTVSRGTMGRINVRLKYGHTTLKYFIFILFQKCYKDNIMRTLQTSQVFSS